MQTFLHEVEEETGAPNTPIPILRGDQLLALRPPPWLIDGVLGMETLALLYAEPSVGKTFLAVYLALAIANGLRCLGGRAVRQGLVLYVAAEGGHRFKRRIQAWGKKHPKVPHPAANLFCVTEAVNLLGEKAVDDLITSVGETLRGMPVLVIFDTLARCMAGGDENSARDMGRVVDALARLQQIFGCTVLVLHHPGKDAEKGERGSSALAGALDTRMMLKKITTDGQRVRLSCKKQKDGPKFEPIELRLSVVDLDEDEDGTPIESCVIRCPRAPEPSLAEQFKIEHRREVLEILVRDGEATFGALEKKGIPHTPLNKALSFLTEENYAEKRGDGKYVSTPKGKKALKQLTEKRAQPRPA